jgi:hypothetical protein
VFRWALYVTANDFWRKRKYAIDKGFVGFVECWDLVVSSAEVVGG